VIDISSQRWARIAGIGMVAVALGLSSCGRKGPLDPPPAAAVPGALEGAPADLPPQSRQAGGVGPDGKAIAPPPSGRREPFFLDWLLD
jgi:predicted small lipoprotein YifL